MVLRRNGVDKLEQRSRVEPAVEIRPKPGAG